MLFLRVSLIAVLLGPLATVAQVRVIDGDTLEIDGTVFRINGIDAPEPAQKCGDWRCGEDATDALAGLVDGHKVECDPLSQDGYGRTIATCFVGGVDIGETLVDKGHAWAFLKYADTYEATQQKAKTLGVGVWSGAFETPWEFRANRWAESQEQAPEGCPIKGNISQNGRIYHTPWSPWYARTRINEAKGERWFCDEAEALAAGWRAPYWQ